MVGIICSVRNDYMVEEVDAHYLTCPLDALRQFIVISARCQSSAWVVVNGCKDGCVTQYGFTHECGIALSLNPSFGEAYNYRYG